ncbi:FtsX-like permease family protein [Paenibacillus sp. LMG 31459]|uniref:FtsX-like permease family protein n=1 Tax=Paenibacillus phytohabitans TaxID=2654978 RepID=A0ABX1YLC4_9BACL|nr:ABC transporter permease [Paenibacillus phytohabitans]NOU81857.1 FtsX-like permease family protein [Paenibacillus phytohabitans]
MYSVQGKLAWSNIRKRKSSTAALFLLIMLAVVLLYTGVSVILKLGSFQEQKMTELKTPDVISYFATDEHLKEYEALLDTYPYTAMWEMEPALLLSEVSMKYGPSDITTGLLILNADQQRTLAPFRTISPVHSDGTNLIYLSYVFHVGAGYNTGDSLSFTYGNQVYTYKIGGFIEEPLIGTLSNGAPKVFMPGSTYRELAVRTGQTAKYSFLSAAVTNPDKAEKLRQLLREQLSASGTSATYVVMSAQSGISGNLVFVNFLTAILLAFALIMVVISLIVIRFQILEHIEDHMQNIGVLKANGYTSWQVITALLLQFAWISIAAAIPGIAAAGAVMPYAGNLISSSIGLIWPASFDILAALVSMLFIMAMVMAVTIMSSRRIRDITPIAALQSGLLTHNFKKNRMPLEHSPLGLQFALGLKTLLRQTKQNIMILLIVAGLTFSSIACSILNYNFTGDTNAVLQLVGFEQSTIQLVLNSGKLQPERIAQVKSLEGVRKTTLLDSLAASVQDTSITLKVSDDFDTMETQTVYKGRPPIYDNEIAVSGIIARQEGKTIGDEIEVSTNGVSGKYLICGFSQQINQLGMVATMTDKGLKRLLPDYTLTTLNVYLNEGADPNVFTQELERNFPGQWSATNVEEMLQGMLGTFTSAITSMTAVITAVTIIVVTLILYLVIKTLILKRKREFGILKGLGYTTFNLITQITFSLLPVVALGVLAGSLLGYFYSDTVFEMLLSSLGIYNIQFAANLPQILLLSTALIAAAFIVSLLVSLRIRRISVYGLITE